ncbi:MAG: pyridoxal phosphate-dependent aminotransferase [Candidatus Porifericomitaceae bacterium WSBS_2022_MAG_OTU9]
MSNGVEECVRRCLRQEILQVEAYQGSPEAKAIIRSHMDAAESPYNLARQQQLQQKIGDLELNLYPPGNAAAMLASLRRYFSVPDQYAMLAGNGSDELIQIIATAMATNGACALAAEPCFVMYRRLSTMAKLEYVGVPLQRHSLQFDMPAMRAAIKKHQPRIIWVANPNNPTGIDCNRDDLAEIIDLAPGVVVVDEAYQPYAGTSILRQPLAANVLVLNTLSKIGFAGLRVGALIAQPQWIQQLDKVRLPYNINTTSQHIVELMLQNVSLINEKVQAVCADRAQLLSELERLGCTVWPSATNFLLVRIEGRANHIHSQLAAQGIAVKNMHNSHPLLDNCIRITVGTPQDNAQLIGVLQQSLQQ